MNEYFFQVWSVYEVRRVFLELVQMIAIWQQLRLLKVSVPINRLRVLIIKNNV